MKDLEREFFEACHSMKRVRLDEMLEDVSVREMAILELLLRKGSQNEELINVSAIACKANTSIQSLSRTIRNLEQKQYVERITDSENRRNTLVRITQTGEKVMEKNYEQMKQFSKNVINRMPEEDMRKFIELQNNLHTIMREEKEKIILERTNKED